MNELKSRKLHTHKHHLISIQSKFYETIYRLTQTKSPIRAVGQQDESRLTVRRNIKILIYTRIYELGTVRPLSRALNRY